MEVVNQYGTFLDNHVTKTERCNLCALSMVLVEVLYDADLKTITELISLKTRLLLDQYSNLKRT